MIRFLISVYVGFIAITCMFLYVFAYMYLAEGDYHWALFNTAVVAFNWFFMTHVIDWMRKEAKNI